MRWFRPHFRPMAPRHEVTMESPLVIGLVFFVSPMVSVVLFRCSLHYYGANISTHTSAGYASGWFCLPAKKHVTR